MDDDQYDDDLYQSAAQTPQKHDESGLESSGEDSYLGDLERAAPAEAFDDTPSSTKRPLEDDADEPTGLKRQRLDLPLPHPSETLYTRNLLDLPEPCLQHAFTYLNVVDLRACFKVCQTFRKCLTVTRGGITVGVSKLPAISGDDIWQKSWDRCAEALPAPLDGISIRRMVELLTADHCESCFTRPQKPPERRNFWNSGPGMAGVRVIWQFQARLCGTCFEGLTAKDVELIITTDKVLLPLLPFVFRTAEKNYMSPSQFQSRSAAPSSLSIFKVYYRPSLGKARDTFEVFKSNFPDALDGYLKDTTGAAKRKIEDAARWVNWEMTLPSGTSMAQNARGLLVLVDTPAIPPDSMARDYAAGYTPTSNVFSGIDLSAPSGSTSQPGQQPQNLATPEWFEKKSAEINATRKARQEEIERRAAEEFDPPLYPSVLQHMAAFRSALMPARPLADSEWLSLKPRLFQERLRAERTEQSRLGQVNSGDYVDLITQRVNRHKGVIGHDQGGDNQQEHAQKPVRKKLLAIADRVIQGRWGGCRRLYIADVENFTADALLTTLDQFRLETDPAEFAMGHRVTLETMKHLFDHRIKPITDNHMRDLFVCSECDDISKKYTFDGMMQHFGAKHDSDFGVGNVVVSWHTAEWPDDPPFKRHPIESRRVPPIYAESTWETKAPEPQPSIEVPMIHHNPADIDALLRSLQSPHNATSNHNLLSTVQNTLTARGLSTASREHTVTPNWGSTTSKPVSEERQTSVEPTAIKTQPKIKAIKEKDVDHHPDHKSDNPWLQKYQPPPKQASVEEREEVGKATKDLVTATGAIPDLDDSVRLKAIICHVAQRFMSQFSRPMDIGTFSQALSTRPEMKPLKKWSGLHCHECVFAAGEGGLVPLEQLDPGGAAKPYPLGSLLQHYKLAHVDSGGHDFPAAWLENMIELPHIEAMKEMVYMKGMTQKKLELLAAAVPKEVFPEGVPQLQTFTAMATPPPVPDAISDATLAALASSLVNPFGQGQSAHMAHGFDSPGAQNGKRHSSLLAPHGNDDTEVSMTEADEDEYDPRRPTMISNTSPPSPRRRSGGQKPKDKSKEKVRGKTTGGSGEIKKKKRLPEDDVYEAGIPDVIRTEYIPGEHDKEEGQITEDDEEESGEEESPAPSPIINRRISAQHGKRKSSHNLTPDQPRSRQRSAEPNIRQQSKFRGATDYHHLQQAKRSDRNVDAGPVLPTSYEEYKRAQQQQQPQQPPPTQRTTYVPTEEYIPPPPLVPAYTRPESIPPPPNVQYPGEAAQPPAVQSQRYEYQPAAISTYGQIPPPPPTQYQPTHGLPSAMAQFLGAGSYAQQAPQQCQPPSSYNRPASPYTQAPQHGFPQQQYHQAVQAQPPQPPVYGQQYPAGYASPYGTAMNTLAQPQYQHGYTPQQGQQPGRSYDGGYDSGGY